MDSFGMGSLGHGPQASSDDSLPTAHNTVPDQSNLLRFWESNEDPWTPLGQSAPTGLTPRHKLNIPAPRAYYTPRYDFTDSGYRSVGQPSECGTLGPDSGYGGSSGIAYSSVESASVHEDDRGVDSQMVDQSQMVGQLMNTSLLDGESQAGQMSAYKHYCEDCNKYVRTQSELNKHTQRHRKPHRCTYPDCTRRDGFSTTNDLQRHKRTVHNEHDGKKYICHLGNCQKKLPKKWPRADNFRSHLLRVHGQQVNSDADLSRYLADKDEIRPAAPFAGTEARPSNCLGPFDMPRQQIVTQSLRASDETGKSPSEDSEDISLHGFILQSTISGNRASHSRDDHMQYIQPDVLQGPNGRVMPGLQSHENAGQSFMEDLHQSDDVDTNIMETDRMSSLTDSGPHDKPEPSWEEAESAATPMEQADDMVPQPSTSDSESKDFLLSGSLPDKLADPAEILKALKAYPRNLLMAALQGESDGFSGTKAQHGCEKCEKHFTRPCELKKHMKRHEKPYGCTFRQCTKVFGSKNDWKRHESSQHLPLETWNCDEGECEKICHRRESFRNHLTRDHHMADVKLIEEKLEKCRMGRHCGTSFWCGFCIRYVAIEEEGVNWWTKRCDHIDNHLFGKDNLEKKSIIQWVYIEDMDEKQDASGSGSTEQQPLAQPPIPSNGFQPPVSSNIDNATGRKRKPIIEVDDRPSKKAVRQDTIMWTCCLCINMMNYKTSSQCFQCGHQRCESDKIERVSHSEDY